MRTLTACVVFLVICPSAIHAESVSHEKDPPLVSSRLGAAGDINSAAVYWVLDDDGTHASSPEIIEKGLVASFKNGKENRESVFQVPFKNTYRVDLGAPLLEENENPQLKIISFQRNVRAALGRLRSSERPKLYLHLESHGKTNCLVRKGSGEIQYADIAKVIAKEQADFEKANRGVPVEWYISVDSCFSRTAQDAFDLVARSPRGKFTNGLGQRYQSKINLITSAPRDDISIINDLWEAQRKIALKNRATDSRAHSFLGPADWARLSGLSGNYNEFVAWSTYQPVQPQFIELLREGSSEEAIFAGHEFERFVGKPTNIALGQMTRLSVEGDSEIRRLSALAALVVTGHPPPDAFARLESYAVKSRDEKVRDFAIELVGSRYGTTEEGARVLASVLQSEKSASIRHKVLPAFLKLGPKLKTMVPTLRQIIDENIGGYETYQIGRSVLDALGETGDSSEDTQKFLAKYALNWDYFNRQIAQSILSHREKDNKVARVLKEGLRQLPFPQRTTLLKEPFYEWYLEKKTIRELEVDTLPNQNVR